MSEEAGRIFELTPKAREMLLDAVSKNGFAGREYVIRVEVFEGGGCACGCGGLAYAMSLADRPLEGDVVEEVDGVRLATPKETLELVRGSTIDYYEGFEASGFIVINPNQQSGSCGCGGHH